MGKRGSGLIGERESVNPVLQQKKREKEMQRKRHKDSKSISSGKGTHGGNSTNDSDKGVESRTKAWKDAQQFRSVPEYKRPSLSHTSVSHDVSNESLPVGAKYSVYFDLVTNRSGQPPINKPVAYKHKDGVIRSFPPADSASSSSSDSSESSSDEEYVLPPTNPIVQHVIRPSAPIPVRHAPPPRPMGVPPKRPVLLPSFVPLELPIEVPEENVIASQPAAPSEMHVILTEDIVIESHPTKPMLFLPSALRRK